MLALSAGSVQGIHDGIFSIGRALAREQEAANLVAAMKDRIGAVHNAVKHRRAPTVVALEWTDPVFAMGNWGPELIEAANGRLVLGEKGEHSSAIDWQQVRDADPEWLIVAPCGFDLERTTREAPMLKRCRAGATCERSVRGRWCWRTATGISTDPAPRSSRPSRFWRKFSTDIGPDTRARPG